jgi:protein involved in polysaccharide export with SLBB domain
MQILLLKKVQKASLGRLQLLLALFALTLGVAGCKTQDTTGLMEGPSASDPAQLPRLRVGDTVTITFSGLDESLLAQEKPIKDDGTITLPDIGSVQAAGKTAGELEDAIHELYVPKIYKHLNVTVKITSNQVYFVRGEVKNPNQVMYNGPTTVTKAIASSGDFTDFADRKRVWLIRSSGKRFKLNAVKILNGEAPDPPIYPGDQIVVDRRWY